MEIIKLFEQVTYTVINQYKKIMNRKIVFFMMAVLMLFVSINVSAQTISPLVGEAIRAFRNNEFETAREKACLLYTSQSPRD